jgi:hypothetical protein
MWKKISFTNSQNNFLRKWFKRKFLVPTDRIESMFSSAKRFKTKFRSLLLRNSELCYLRRNKIPRVCFNFCSTVQNSELSLLQNGWERSFLVRGTAKIPQYRPIRLYRLADRYTTLCYATIRLYPPVRDYSINLDTEAILTTYYAHPRNRNTQIFRSCREKWKVVKVSRKALGNNKIQEILSWIWGEI